MSIVDEAQLISPDWLAAHLDDPQVRIFDVTVHLRPDPPRTYRVESGRADYQAAHIPGAAFLDLARDLSDTDSGLSFTLPDAATLQAAFEAAGADADSHLVLYSASHPMWATRVWWMLRGLGVDHVGVLDGGLSAWKAAGHPLRDGDESHAPGRLQTQPRPELWVDKATMQANIGADAVCTINALSSAVYRGEGDMHYGRRGHIPGSVNVPYAHLFDRDTGRWQDADTLQAAFDAVQAMDRPVVCYCGGGISATCDAFALTRLGHEQVAVYDGSMSEWVRDAELPLVEGATP